MYRILLFALLLSVVPLAGASSGVNIYMDIHGDVTHKERTAPRLKLRKQKGLALGRMAGVWGSVGKRDAGDAFFLGKTPVPARMRFTLASSKQHAPVQLSVTARDGNNVVKHDIQVLAGESVEQWLVLKGRITVVIDSPTGNESVYAAYFWYPGDRLDGMNDEEFNRVKSGKTGTVPSFARRSQGRAVR